MDYRNQTVAAAGQGGDIRQQSELEYTAGVLENSLIRAEAKLGDLIARLAPIIEDRPTNEAGTNGPAKTERPVYSRLGQGIMETSYRLNNLERRIQSVLESLAI